MLKLKYWGIKRTRADNEMETCLYKGFIWIVKGVLTGAFYGMDGIGLQVISYRNDYEEVHVDYHMEPCPHSLLSSKLFWGLGMWFEEWGRIPQERPLWDQVS